MSETDSDFTDIQRNAIGRLASLERLETLQRLHAQAEAGNRTAMLKSIKDLIELERRALARDTDSKPA